MSIREPMVVVHLQVAWMVATVLFLVVVGAFSPDLFVLLSVIGLVIVAEVTTPVNVAPAWHSRVRWLLGVALVVFVILASWRLWVIVPPEVFP
ncbi:hypothetical protein ACYJ1Y_02175 [Natrialbaceae archaeon A-gly3]